VASKSAYWAQEQGAEVEELLDNLDKLLDRLKVMYEQYFLGISKLAPTHLHTDAERKMREIAQIQIRNTGLRYRYATLSQKFGAYNTYWKRTLRQIEQGRYVRNLSRVSRKAAVTGDDIPEEVLAAMPKLMRERVIKDRQVAVANAERRKLIPDHRDEELADDEPGAPPAVPRSPRSPMASDGGDDGIDAPSQISSKLTDEEREFLAAYAAEVAPPPPPRPAPRKKEPSMGGFVDMRGMLLDELNEDEEWKRGGDLVPGKVARPAPAARPAPVAARPAPAAARPAPVDPPPAAAKPPALGERTRPPVTSRPIPAPPPRAAAPAAPPRRSQDDLSLPPGMSEADVRTLYTKYTKARELVGEKSDASTYPRLLRTLREQAPKIMGQHNAQGVEFGVVIKDKKVILKAKPKP
jgi:hypothetical protein